ncbi:MAG: hypothetical protein IJH07_07430 [Ruminococcus sp.]|nr:hypothetical protein [Ruminococcus sp.]
MNKKMIGIIALTLCVILAALSFTACGGSKPAIVGSWESDEASGVIYTFNEDGTGSLAGEGYEMTLTYTLKDDTISFTYNGGSEVQTFNYKIENNVLSIIDPEGGTITYSKK